MTSSLHKLLASFLLVVFCHQSIAQPISNNPPPLTIVTEDFPPLQIVENKRVVGGIATEIVHAMLAVTGDKTQIMPYSWGRAYKEAKENKNVMIYSITRSTTREPYFKWIGPIMALDNHLWRLTSRSEIKINHIEDAKNYHIAVPKGDEQHQRLLRLGFSAPENLQVVTRYNQSIEMLFRQRVDLIAGSKVILMHQLKTLGKSTDEITHVINMAPDIGRLYIAFSAQTDNQLVDKYRQALKTIKQNGTYHAIMQRWQATVAIDQENIIH